MAQGFRSVAHDGAHVLTGAFDEAADFSPLALDAAPVLRLNLAGIQTINSLGLRRLIAFSRGIGDRAVEFLECPPVFIEAVNVTPLAIGGQRYVSRIKSVVIPYHCPSDHEHTFGVPIATVRQGDEIVLPVQSCPTCKQAMTPDLESDAEEFFFFLSV